MNDTLSKIKQFESQLKALLIHEYGRFLPTDRVNILKATNYTTNDLLNCKSAGELRGKLLRRMLADTIKMKTTKEVSMPDGSTITINYGESLERSLINYYAHELAQKYQLDVSELGDIKDDLESIKALYDKIGNKVDYSAFNEDAVKLLKKADIKEITQKYDEQELQKYLKTVQKVAAMGEEDKQKQSDMLNEATERIDSIQIVWLKEKKHIKYTDQYGEVHLTDISNAPSVEDYYKEKLASLGPNEKIDPEEFYHELVTYYTKEIEMHPTKDIDRDELGSKQVNMLDFIQTNRELASQRADDIMKHNQEIDIHVMQGSKDIVTTEDKDDHVEAHLVKDGEAEAKTSMQQDISSQLISKDEYKRLTEKFYSNEELSEEEQVALRRAAPVYAEEVLAEMQEARGSQEGGAVLKPKTTNTSGFTLKTFALYFVVLTLLIGSFIAILILR